MTSRGPRPFDRLVDAAGGRSQLRTVGLLSGALALAAGDQTIVGAVAPDLKVALGVDNTAVGLLITAASLVGAATTLPFGMLADRTTRVRLLTLCVLSWSASIVVAGFAPNYVTLLIAQVALGAGIGAATPVVASLTGDLFPAASRGRVYGLILAGEFLGAATGLVLAGEMAAWWSWRGSFWVLALPGPVLAYALARHLPEPRRGGMDPVGADPVSTDSHPEIKADQGSPTLTRLVVDAGVPPHKKLVLSHDPTHESFRWALRYVLSIRTNVLIIIASALAYYYVAGLQAFIVVWLRGRFDFTQGVATLLLMTVGIAVVVGTLVTGPLSDRFIARGAIAARPLVAGIACLVAVAFVLPGLLISAFLLAWPILLIGAAAIGGTNPPLDAARLDIMHSRLWGRAESVRTFIQTLFKSSAPLVFGWLSVLLSPAGRAQDAADTQGGGAAGLTRALIVMLLVILIAGGLLLVSARRSYPRDVATAIASEAATR
ncbi:MFS transporter [Nakamurella antarctica]|uniref:MFS transporter n=1 Tax=Nakamurella antarctica TaxID=1902245 RepID=A0A3G8ZN35_9ACTN|nr:MFS transporter [Nakamurella antarctica]AZI58217.1 MFS transporter [Nakamurella antarctica]